MIIWGNRDDKDRKIGELSLKSLTYHEIRSVTMGVDFQGKERILRAQYKSYLPCSAFDLWVARWLLLLVTWPARLSGSDDTVSRWVTNLEKRYLATSNTSDDYSAAQKGPEMSSPRKKSIFGMGRPRLFNKHEALPIVMEVAQWVMAISNILPGSV